MREFIRDAHEHGWRRTVEDRMAKINPASLTILLGQNRASFAGLINPPAKRNILDLGAGMGAISLQLSHSFERVYALDQTFERMAFLQVVADQEGAKSIRTVCHRDVFSLPFASDSLDAVVMVGVFEYFPASYPQVSIRDAQLRALAELYRTLVPGGVLFIATKNRYGWANWIGAKDNSGLPYGPLLPRWLANMASKSLLNRPFRIVTDSYHGYTSLLSETGFQELRFYWPVGGYQASESWINLDDQAALNEEIRKYPAGKSKRGLFSALNAAGAIKYLVPHFGIVAKKPH